VQKGGHVGWKHAGDIIGAGPVVIGECWWIQSDVVETQIIWAVDLCWLPSSV